MEIKKYIKIYDNILPFPTLSNLLKFANICKFKETKVGGGDLEIIDFNVRKTYSYPLSPLFNELTNVHWSNLLHFYFNNKLNQYKKDLNIIDFSWSKITTIEILKYQDNGFYTWHIDHFAEIPRTMSCIFLLNNDYEGGNLCFRNPDGSGEWEVEVKPNRMIIWPSNFLYPHTVKPVTKGTRYSVVAWAI
jgi:hypothetical protein